MAISVGAALMAPARSTTPFGCGSYGSTEICMGRSVTMFAGTWTGRCTCVLDYSLPHFQNTDHKIQLFLRTLSDSRDPVSDILLSQSSLERFLLDVDAYAGGRARLVLPVQPIRTSEQDLDVFGSAWIDHEAGCLLFIRRYRCCRLQTRQGVPSGSSRKVGGTQSMLGL